MTEHSSFLIAGTGSGSGKTTITLGILAALKARGLRVQPFKCGPDFIDPTLHRMVTNEISSNLDLRMCGKDFCQKIFNQRFSNKDVAVVEGVMGLFDGGEASSAALACELNLPVILVVDARSAAESVAALVKGFETFSPESNVIGVIFNQVGSARHRELIERGMAGNCKSQILGFFPRNQRFTIQDRHLGLHMGEENPLDGDGLRELAGKIEEHIDLDLLLKITVAKNQEGTVPRSLPGADVKKRARLAVAKDAAFCFYYPDNLRMLEDAGAELVYFSPLHDSSLPAGCDAVYFGGGYPELFADELSRNRSMLSSVVEFAEANGIIYGECGGFMYLCSDIVDLEGQSFTMSNVFPFQVQMKARLSRLGYRKARVLKECFLALEGEYLHGHEFHYSELCAIPEKTRTLYELADKQLEGYHYKNVIGGYLHLHFARHLTNLDFFIDTLEQSDVST